LVVSSPALSATLYLADSFEDNNTAGPLSGQDADTGQTWGGLSIPWPDPVPTSMDVGTEFGLNFSIGAGTTEDSHIAGGRGNSIGLGTTITGGKIVVSMDFQTQAPGFGAATFVAHQFWLRNASSGALASVGWGEPGGGIQFQGLGLSDSPHSTGFQLDDPNANSGEHLTGSMHVTLNIDLDNKTVSYSWYDNADPLDPNNSGTVDVGTYAGSFTPDTLDIYGYGQSLTIASGFDNIIVSEQLEGELVSDDFDGNTGSLRGQQADSGQTYYDPGWATPSPEYNTWNGILGTQGAGTSLSGGATAALDFTPQVSGVIRLEVDMSAITSDGVWNAGGTANILLINTAEPNQVVEISLDSVNGLSIQQLVNSGPHAYLKEANEDPLVGVQGGANIILDIDLDDQSVDLSWQGFTSTTWAFGDSGSVEDLPYAMTFNPNQIIVHSTGGRSGLNYGGYDNLNLYQLSCSAAIARGLSLIPGDLDENCRIDLLDFSIFSGNFLECNDPVDPACP
jgi:hypothetical protein